jgi:hypothetical protein
VAAVMAMFTAMVAEASLPGTAIGQTHAAVVLMVVSDALALGCAYGAGRARSHQKGVLR